MSLLRTAPAENYMFLLGLVSANLLSHYKFKNTNAKNTSVNIGKRSGEEAHKYRGEVYLRRSVQDNSFQYCFCQAKLTIKLQNEQTPD